MKPGPNNGIGMRIRADTASRPIPMAALFLLVLVLSLAAATQYFAHAFQYHAALGAHQNFLYAPWKILEWAKLWPDRYGNEFSMAGSVATMTAALGLRFEPAAATGCCASSLPRQAGARTGILSRKSGWVPNSR